MREALAIGRVEAGTAHLGADIIIEFGAADDAMDEGRLADRRSDAHARIEARLRVLEDELHVAMDGAVALPELMEDLAALGMASILVEGGAEVAKAFLEKFGGDSIEEMKANLDSYLSLVGAY